MRKSPVTIILRKPPLSELKNLNSVILQERESVLVLTLVRDGWPTSNNTLVALFKGWLLDSLNPEILGPGGLRRAVIKSDLSGTLLGCGDSRMVENVHPSRHHQSVS